MSKIKNYYHDQLVWNDPDEEQRDEASPECEEMLHISSNITHRSYSKSMINRSYSEVRNEQE